MRAVIRRKKGEAAEQAYRGVMNHPHQFIGGDASRKAWADWARGEVMGHRGSAPGGGQPSGPGKSADDEADELLK